jgi:hypothetical protein
MDRPSPSMDRPIIIDPSIASTKTHPFDPIGIFKEKVYDFAIELILG